MNIKYAISNHVKPLNEIMIYIFKRLKNTSSESAQDDDG
jgi:serine phosphatase RsbU (regulator of sigma subunit)